MVRGGSDVPKIPCDCGEILRYGEIPCPIEWLIVPEDTLRGFCDQVESDVLLWEHMRHFLKCPRCERLLIFWKDFNHAPSVYAPDLSGMALGRAPKDMPSSGRWLMISDVTYDAFQGMINPRILSRQMNDFVEYSGGQYLVVNWGGSQSSQSTYWAIDRPEAGPRGLSRRIRD